MIEIKVPKEIKTYQEKVFISLTLRQVISVVLIAVIAIPLYIFGAKLIGDLISLVVMLVVAPIAAFGFVRWNDMNFEQIFEAIMTTMFLYPANRIYESENIYAQIAKQLEEEAESNGKSEKAAAGGKTKRKN